MKRLTPLKIAMIYGVIGAFWILFSDGLVAVITDDPTRLIALETYKGWFFVLVTACVLYTLVKRGMAAVQKSEMALQESQQSYSTLVANLPGMAYSCYNDREWTMQFISEGCLALTGYAASDMIGNRKIAFAQLIHPEDREAVWEQVQDALRANQAFLVTYRITTAQGEEKWVWEQGRGVSHSDEGQQMVDGFIIDITERKQLEEELIQSQKMESVGQLAGGVAHDFNNQLGIMLFDLDMLLEDLSDDDTMHEDLTKMRNVVLRSSNLTRQLLLFSRRQPMSLQPVNLNHQVQELQKMLGRVLGEDILVEMDLSDDLWSVNADFGNIDQVLMNLAINARDAMPYGGTLRIETKNVVVGETYCRQTSTARPGSFVCLAVSDTGEGMAEETVVRIFEPFFTTKEREKGTGLGLSVVYGIVQAHEGWITVHSLPRKGSRFEVFLPAKILSEDEVTDLLDGSKGSKQEGGHQERILLLEDEADLKVRVEKVLTANGYLVSSFSTVAEAREAFQKEASHFDLVVSDVVLPDGRGSDLVLELLEKYPDLGVLLVTGYTDERTDWRQIEEAGLPVLQKPFGVNDLIESVQRLLAERDGNR